MADDIRLDTLSFLNGSNAAYIEDLQARYQADPNSVDAQWQAFFAGLGEGASNGARGASWQKPNWPLPANGELVSALDGNWPKVEAVLFDKMKSKAAEGKARDNWRRQSGGAAIPSARS